MDKNRDIGHRIRVISNLIKRQLVPLDASLSGMQLHVLSYIFCSGKELFQKDIEAKFNIRRSTATGILKNLEKNGFITREISENDSRLKKISLTKKALIHRESTEKDIKRIEALITKGLTENEIEEFFRITDKIKNNLEGDDIK